MHYVSYEKRRALRSHFYTNVFYIKVNEHVKKWLNVALRVLRNSYK